VAAGIEKGQAEMPMVEIRANHKLHLNQPLAPQSLLLKGKYSPLDIPALHEQWFKKYSDLLGPIPLELPPFREVNHRILLMDDNLRYNYHLPKMS
jgi:hypothetical protein